MIGRLPGLDVQEDQEDGQGQEEGVGEQELEHPDQEIDKEINKYVINK